MVEPHLRSKASNKVFLGLGSNKGNRRKFLLHAIQEIRPLLKNVTCSSVYESDALLPAGAPLIWNNPFLNLVITGDTGLEPLQLLPVLKHIEKKLGRQNTERWSPREIDIDILLMPGKSVNLEKLKIPHPEIAQRPFVVLPLKELYPSFAEINPEWKSKMPFNTRKIDWRADEPQIMGILNITPDSFSDGGKFRDLRIQELLRQGADILDLGGESTRPGAKPLSWQEEFSRIQGPLKQTLEIIKSQYPEVQVSVDTYHPETAERAIEMGSQWINDVSGLQNPSMVELAKKSEVEFVFMHNLGLPADPKKVLDPKADPVLEVYNWAKNKLEELETQGIKKERLVFDPGIGFGKTPEQNLVLVSRMDEFGDLGTRIMVGHSRKSYLKLLTDAPAPERDFETVVTSQYLADKNVNFLRVHNVELNKKVIRAMSHMQMARGVFFDDI